MTSKSGNDEAGSDRGSARGFHVVSHKELFRRRRAILTRRRPLGPLHFYQPAGIILMASSLATQLAQNASLNASLLVDRSRRKPTQSYLFSSREADQHDLDAIHALASNAFFRLRTVEPVLSDYEDALFSEAAKATDRTLQNAELNAKLDESLNSFLPLLGPYLLESPTGKIIEWLVRRFRVNEFNVEALFTLFLPYQESPHFTKMLSIVHLSCVKPLLAINLILTILQGNVQIRCSHTVQEDIGIAFAQSLDRPHASADER